MDTATPWDFAIVGSGFGGSVAALRLSEKGYRVAVLEQGRRVGRPEIDAAQRKLRHYLWQPSLGWTGYFVQHVFRHLVVLGGVGVGGGSLVYGAVLLRPKPDFFRDPAWSGLGVDWEAELREPYAVAERMLGCAVNPRATRMDDDLKRTARAMGAAASYGPVPNGIFFGAPGETHDDPYFGGAGPGRVGCTFCGGCLGGCPHGSKNTLDFNYLHLAERTGAQVLPQHKVTHIEPCAAGYRLHVVDPLAGNRARPAIEARKVILAAGVVGSLEVLFASRDRHRTLPGISPRLGQQVRTNSEAIVGVLAPPDAQGLDDGTAISSHFFADAHTHITQNRMAPAQRSMALQTGPLIDGAPAWWRSLRTLAALVLRPVRTLRLWLARRWPLRAIVLTVMQHVDNQLAFRYRRSWLSPFTPRLRSELSEGGRIPTYLPVANRAARALAKETGGQAFNFLPESLGDLAVTAHILGGCPMGLSRDEGVIDPHHEVFGHPGLYVVDGSAIPANLGVNPSLTITALAERCMRKIPRSGAALED